MLCRKHVRRVSCLFAAYVIVVLTPRALEAQASKTPEVSADELVRATVANEVAASNHPNPQHIFRSRKQTPKGSQTRLYVETNEALAAMLIAVDDHPLTPEQQQAENGHLDWLMHNPEQLRKKHAREKEDEERTMQIVKALPDAFHYQYDGTEPAASGTGKPGDELVKLKFEPNPEYSPPSHVEQILTGMQGELIIDNRARRIAKIEGTLFRGVSFGWGIIGHLDKGGHFMVKQGDLGLGDGEWGITEISMDITGKILMIKSLKMVSDEVLSDFREAGKSLTFAQGVELLRTAQDKLAHDARAAQNSEAQKSDPQKNQK